ncbi:hypothetical protein PPEP_a6008 [Pseudoalteromonas peptidolytica F12-50-A1]|uniref:Uncharacterized protein n=1 Tax=Pseudoalteromonas peptidolytica F12-50-A1 TaxID=1315280 RepID=A0A8I0T592_9GAMM|nr:hypothetical protein [Pseudoalteromonas peptidolytica F12-50-A1]
MFLLLLFYLSRHTKKVGAMVHWVGNTIAVND